MPNDDGGQRQRALDGLRALGMAAVMCAHAGPPVIRRYMGVGTDPVIMFFVLSSFLITRILLTLRNDVDADRTTRGHAFRAFYARRFLRIFPLYYLVLAIAALVGVPEIVHYWPWHVFYLSNWWLALSGRWIVTAGHLWTLAIEEQFYLIWPLFVLLAPRRWLPYVIGAAIICAPVSRFVIFTMTANEPLTLRTTVSALDGLAGGAALALLWEYEDAVGARSMMLRHVALVLSIVGIVGITMAYWSGEWLRYYLALASCVMTLTGVWLVDAAARGFRGMAQRVFTHPVMVYLGTISYGLYLYHAFVIWGLQRVGIWDKLGPKGSLSGLALVAAITFVISAASWAFFERPINDLKRYFPYRERGAHSVHGVLRGRRITPVPRSRSVPSR